MFSRYSPRIISIASLVIAFVALVSSGVYVASSESNAILACADKKNGALRLSDKCKKSERPVSWNKIGPQGLPGPQGIPGPKGDPGDAGTTTVLTQSIVQKVYDSTGSLLGDYLSIDSSGSATVKRSGSIITYGGSSYSGYLIINGFTYYLTSNCTGSKYATLSNRANYSIENPYVSADLMSRNESDFIWTVGYTQGEQIDKSADSVFVFSNGVCVPTSSPDAGDGPVTRVKLLTTLSIPTKASPPYTVR